MARNRTPDFEDRVSADWPDELRQLANIAGAQWSIFADLDDRFREQVAAGTPMSAGPLHALAGDAYKLLTAIRAEGERRLAAWEAAQRPAEMAEADECPKCGGRGYEEIGPLSLDCDACAGTGVLNPD